MFNSTRKTQAYLSNTSYSHIGVATHYVPSHRLAALEARLKELTSAGINNVNRTIDEFVEHPGTMHGFGFYRTCRFLIVLFFRAIFVGTISAGYTKMLWQKIS
jgi:hypothetical protein